MAPEDDEPQRATPAKRKTATRQSQAYAPAAREDEEPKRRPSGQLKRRTSSGV